MKLDIRGFFSKIMRVFSRKDKQNMMADTNDSEKKSKADFEDWFEEHDVLVGVLRNAAQLEKCIKDKFYHIPVDQVLGCEFPVKYIAIYQSKKLFGENAGIRYYGEVEYCTTLERCKIREIPKKSTEKYLYFKVKSWHELDTPVRAKEMSFVAFTTSMNLLKNSSELPELFIESKEEYHVYSTLLDLVKELAENGITDYHDIKVLDFMIRIKDGGIYLFMQDVIQCSNSYSEFLSMPCSFVKEIFVYYPELSGRYKREAEREEPIVLL